jgi:septum formation protein
MNNWLILASTSQRRQKLLSKIIRKFEIKRAPEPNYIVKNDSASSEVKRMSEFKAVWVALRNPRFVTIGADTIVEVNAQKLPKPKNKSCAKKFIQLINSKKIQVHTGVCICYFDGFRSIKKSNWTTKSVLKCKKLSHEQIDEYIESNLWHGKAGGFNILEKPTSNWFYFRKKDADNIAGLDVKTVKKRIKKFKVLVFPLKKNR